MNSGVQVRHSAPGTPGTPGTAGTGKDGSGGEISKLAADELRVIVSRDGAIASKPAAAGASTALNLGGAMLIRRINAAGAVYIDTPTRDIDCDELDIDYGTNIARLTARDQRVVTLKADGKPDMVQAKSVQWDLAADVITVTEPVGAVGR